MTAAGRVARRLWSAARPRLAAAWANRPRDTSRRTSGAGTRPYTDPAIGVVLAAAAGILAAATLAGLAVSL